MPAKSNTRKVSTDMFLVQLNWAGGFLGILLLVHIIKSVTAFVNGDVKSDFYSTVFVASHIFALVIGILAVHFLPHFVGHGVTRKHYFRGAAIASAGVSAVVALAAGCGFAIERLLTNVIPALSFKTETIGIIDGDGNLVSTLVQSIIFTPFVNPGEHWLLAVGVAALNMLVYYLAGWVIGAGFYRFDAITGLVFIILGFVFITGADIILRNMLGLPLTGEPLPLQVSAGVGAAGLVLIIAVSLWVVRALTKDITIKLQ